MRHSTTSNSKAFDEMMSHLPLDASYIDENRFPKRESGEKNKLSKEVSLNLVETDMQPHVFPFFFDGKDVSVVMDKAGRKRL